MTMILVVEDDEQVRVLAESILEDGGYQTLTAGTVEEALALVRGERRIDLLFTDFELAEAHDGGLRLAAAAIELRPALAVVYTTGKGVTDGMRALFVDRFSFAPKPYAANDLLAAVRNALQASPLRSVT